MRAPLRLLLALVILFEEWGWQPLQDVMARIARLPMLAQLERLITRLPPTAALVVLAVPWLALLPAKIGALWLLAHGRGQRCCDCFGSPRSRRGVAASPS